MDAIYMPSSYVRTYLGFILTLPPPYLDAPELPDSRSPSSPFPAQEPRWSPTRPAVLRPSPAHTTQGVRRDVKQPPVRTASRLSDHATTYHPPPPPPGYPRTRRGGAGPAWCLVGLRWISSTTSEKAAGRRLLKRFATLRRFEAPQQDRVTRGMCTPGTTIEAKSSVRSAVGKW